jgi:Amidohydrolase family
MPGLIDAHWHTMLVRPTPTALLADDVGYLNLVAGAEAVDTLMRGFTTVRDMGGPSFGLKRAIDEGIVAGPRIYPSGAIITVTGGHGDFRHPSELPRVLGAPLSRQELTGASMIADSPDEVRVRVREQLMQDPACPNLKWPPVVRLESKQRRREGPAGPTTLEGKRTEARYCTHLATRWKESAAVGFCAKPVLRRSRNGNRPRPASGASGPTSLDLLRQEVCPIARGHIDGSRSI